MLTRMPGVALSVILAGEVAAFIAGMATGTLGYWLLVPPAAAILGFVVLTAARRRTDKAPELAVDDTPNYLLIALPTIVAYAAISPRDSTFGIAVVIVAMLWRGLSPDIRLRPTWQSAILPVLGLAIVLRPMNSTTAPAILAFGLAGVAIAGAVYLSASTSSALISLGDGIGLYLIASVVLWLVGAESTGRSGVDGSNTITGGIRVLFPLATAQAATPAAAAVYLAALVPILLVSSRYRTLRLVAAAAAVVVLIYADRRGALIGAFFVAVCALLAPRLLRRAAPLLVGTALFMPFIYGSIQTVFGQTILTASSQAQFLQRQGEGEDAALTLNGRDTIWSRSLDFYQNQVDWVHQTFGFGSFGNSSSGLADNFRSMFGKTVTNRGDITPHNSLLQILFDGGWIIGLVFAAIVLYTTWILSRRTSTIDLATLAMLMTLAFVGSTEVALSPAHSQTTWWILLALGMIVFSRVVVASGSDEVGITGRSSRESGADQPRSTRSAPASTTGAATEGEARGWLP